MSQLEFFLREVPFFKGLTPSDLAKIIPLFMERKLKKGTTLFIEETNGDELYIIKSGKVKVYRFDGSKEVILAIFNEGDYFGEMAIMQKDQVRSASAEILEPSVLYVLKRDHFRSLLEENPIILINLLETAMERIRQSNEFIQNLTALDARSRIFKTITDLAGKYGIAKENGVLVNIKLTHQLIADMSGSVRETVTKALLELQDEDVISIDKKYIFIKNLALLEEKISY